MTENARVAKIECDGAYAMAEIRNAEPIDVGNQVVINYDEKGLKLTVDCPWLVGGMCHNLSTYGMVDEHAALKGTIGCVHLNQVTQIK